MDAINQIEKEIRSTLLPKAKPCVYKYFLYTEWVSPGLPGETPREYLYSEHKLLRRSIPA
jgi:hypothetical protein